MGWFSDTWRAIKGKPTRDEERTNAEANRRAKQGQDRATRGNRARMMRGRRGGGGLLAPASPAPENKPPVAKY